MFVTPYRATRNVWRLKQWLRNRVATWHDHRARKAAERTKRRWSTLVDSLPMVPNGRIALHIGCGDINAPGFINIDARPQPHVHIVTSNLFRLEMIPANVADMIYMSHVLEHVSHREVVITLREMRRILKHGGTLRVSVPDFDRIVEIYQANDRNISFIEQPLMGGQNYPFNYHYAVFNEAHLRQSMLKSGFKESRMWDPQDCDYHDFEDWASAVLSYGERSFPISLNIEAIK